MFLDEIISHKKAEVASRKEQRPLEILQSQLDQSKPVRPFIASLRGDSIRLIAEVKKASPSKGLLCPHFDPITLAMSYEAAGAAAISVLTDERFFQGSLSYLRQVKEVTKQTPVLRKDFIIDPYQLVEARVWGADAVLLIVAALSKTELIDLHREALSLDLAPLVEVHNRPELELALEIGTQAIGINNRDLKTFKVDLATTYQLLEYLPKGVTVVSESGINSNADIRKLSAAGVNAVLIGESIVTAADPERQIKELIGAAS